MEDVGVHNIIMNIREIGLEVVDWMHLAQDRRQWCGLANTVMNIRIPQRAENLLSS